LKNSCKSHKHEEVELQDMPEEDRTTIHDHSNPLIKLQNKLTKLETLQKYNSIKRDLYTENRLNNMKFKV
jgi:hypothetical protein